eukprot:TRINITY_DN104708_c0_g1_i1.p3 TRINITY_DN104708_c0_g1~~TRINITY_DN104708_c0_g1_i1.p3  ORF type:complete len:112 (+),score=7.26 TRINITY_DN104708_c0_g1_i1:2-337(+)
MDRSIDGGDPRPLTHGVRQAGTAHGTDMWRDTTQSDAARRTTTGKEDPSRPLVDHSVDRLLMDLGDLAPEGFSAGLHIRFDAPLLYVRTYNDDWCKLYDDHAYALRDPLVF